MPLTSTATILAAANEAGVAAFNVVTLEQAEGLIMAAELERRPLVLQVSERSLAFHGRGSRGFLCALAELARAASTEVSVHLDHIESLPLLEVAVGTGVSSAMVDASRSPYAENVEKVRGAAQWLHRQGWQIEAELGEIGGKRGAHTPGVRTDPDEAAAYVAATGVDALAVAVGSSHAMTTPDAQLDFDLISAIARVVPVPLVLHGSSGVSPGLLRLAVRAGIVKVNVGTLVSTAYTRALHRALEHTRAVDPRDYLMAARNEVAATAVGVLRSLAAEADGADRAQ